MNPSQRKDIAAFMMESMKKKKKNPFPFGPTKGGPSNIDKSHPMATKKGK